jgi:hypothetical protein
MSTAVANEHDALAEIGDDTLATLCDSVTDGMFEALKQEQRALGELASSLNNAFDAKMFHKVFSELRNHLGKIQSVFEKLLQDSCNGFTESENISADRVIHFCSDELALITDSELSQQLQLEKSFNLACDLFESMRVASGQKFLPIGHELPSDNVMYSVEPGALAWALQHSIASLIADKSVVRVIYRFVGARFFAVIGDSYEKAVPALAGVVKRHKPKASASVSHGTPGMLVEEMGDFGEESELVKAFASRPDILELLRKNDIPSSMSDESHESLNDIALDQLRPDTQIRTMSVEDVMGVLRRYSEDDTGEDLREVLRDALSNLSTDNVVSIIDRVSENVLNLVSHLFAEMNENSQFIPAVKKQLKRLQSPVTQVALVDAELFHRDEHPVRQYLNMVGRLGSLVTSEDEEGFRRLRSNIGTFLKAYNGDTETFRAATGSLTDFVENSEYAIKWQNEELAPQDYKAGMRFVPVRDYLEGMAALLSHELSFHKLTKFVFSAILSKTLVRHGEESPEWKRVTGTYSNILWSTQASANDDGKRLVLRSLPGIVRELRLLCEDYGVKGSVRGMLLDRMFDIHMQIIHGRDGALIEESSDMIRQTFASLRGRVLEDDNCEYYTESDALFNMATDLPVDPRNNVYERFDAISGFDNPESIMNDADQSMEDDSMEARFRALEQVPITTVFEMTDNDVMQRFMLKEKSVVLGRFTFVSADQHTTLTLTKAQLVLRLMKGEARRVEEDAWFDRGLDQVFRKLKMA